MYAMVGLNLFLEKKQILSIPVILHDSFVKKLLLKVYILHSTFKSRIVKLPYKMQIVAI